MVIENLMDHVTFTCHNGFRTHSVHQCKFVGDGAGDRDSTCKRALNFDGDFDGHGYGDVTVTGSNFEITFVSEKHVVEDDVLFTNHLVGK